MKSPDKKRGPPPTGSRTGPRARAAQERQFSDPYQRSARPPRDAEAGTAAERSPQGRNAVVTLEPDVARVFRTSEAVNEALRLVLRLARFGSARPAFDRDRPAGRAPGRPGPFAPRPAGPPRRGPERTETRGDKRPPARREPKFRDSE